MSSRERISAAYQHQEPDRTPMFEYVLYPPVASDILGRKYIDYTDDIAKWKIKARLSGWEKTVQEYVTDRLDLSQKLGHDMMYVCPNPTPEGIGRERAHGNISGMYTNIDR